MFYYKQIDGRKKWNWHDVLKKWHEGQNYNFWSIGWILKHVLERQIKNCETLKKSFPVDIYI